jgi:Na+(H+)/acetate symporter ActP
VTRRAVRGILSAHRESVVIDVAVVNMMQVSVVQIIGMAIVLDGSMAAILAVNMGVTLVLNAGCWHDILPSRAGFHTASQQ